MHSFCRFSQGSNMCTCTQYKVQKKYACYSGNTVINELTIYEDEEILQSVISIKKKLI